MVEQVINLKNLTKNSKIREKFNIAKKITDNQNSKIRIETLSKRSQETTIKSEIDSIICKINKCSRAPKLVFPVRNLWSIHKIFWLIKGNQPYFKSEKKIQILIISQGKDRILLQPNNEIGTKDSWEI